MRNKFFFLLVTLSCLIVSVSGQTRRFDAAPGQTLTLELKGGGSAVVTGWSQSAIEVTYSHSSNVSVDFEQTADGLVIRSDFDRRMPNYRSTSAEFEIRVPHQIDIAFDSLGGGLTLIDLEGRFEGETMGGQYVLEGVRGTAQLSTMGGKILLSDSEVDGSLSTMGGEVLFENVIGDVKGSSMGGQVRYKNVRRRDGSIASPVRRPLKEATQETIQISTMGGSIDVPEAPEGLDVSTMGGSIRVKSADKFARVKTMGGDIHIESVQGWVEATTMAGDVEVQVDGRAEDQSVKLTSMSGDITLIVPSDFSMDLEVKLVYTRNSRQNYEIISDFELNREEGESWQYRSTYPSKEIYGRAVVNGGRNSVYIETVNGNVRIVRQ